jgi:ribonucleoside-diphosphate reductase alpha chain
MSERERLPDLRYGVTHKAVIRAEDRRVKFFFTINYFKDGRPGELFLHMDESGSTLDGFADCWAIAVSMCLQQGITVEKLMEKFAFQEFEPKGFTDNKDIRVARSVVDYVVRFMACPEQAKRVEWAGQKGIV